jgi:diketogulonate reductase-like aldo/keto reductase
LIEHGPVALAWLRTRSVPVIPIIGARKLSQLQDNLASFDLTHHSGQVKTLDDASQIELGFRKLFSYVSFPRASFMGGLREQIWLMH